MLKIEFTTENAAFGENQEEKADEVCRILQKVRYRIFRGDTSGVCMDLNGNKVGEWSLD